MTMNNWLLCTDVYKLGHMEQYPKGTTEVYSYLHTRSDRKYLRVPFFGLQYLLKKYLSEKITYDMCFDLAEIRRGLIGDRGSFEFCRKLSNLSGIGYLPLKIRAVPEGTMVNNPNALMTIVNTHPEFSWLPGYLESFFLQLWNPCTVAAMSRKYYEIAKKFGLTTCDNLDHLPYAVHDFGYRGVSSNETAAISGAAHLINFLGSDTIPAVKLIKDYYGPCDSIAKSVPASEHSVMCAFGRNFELEAFENMLSLYPNGIVSVVADTYDVYNAVTVIAGKLKDKIMSRPGKVVFRPDSGEPNLIINGDKSADTLPAADGVLKCLHDVFGGTVNGKGYKVLDEHVGLIYGDGIFYERYVEILSTMQANRFASSNLVVGVGGLLLQQHNRDDMGFSIKATNVVVNGESRMIYKSPITDPGKKSHRGKIMLVKNGDNYSTIDQEQSDGYTQNEMRTVYLDGKILIDESFDQIRSRVL